MRAADRIAPPRTKSRSESPHEHIEHKVNLERLRAHVQELKEVIGRANSRSAAQNARDIFRAFLREFSISEKRSFKSLLESDDDPVYTDWRSESLPTASRVLANMQRMLKLEEQQPGVVQFLYAGRGIRNFIRLKKKFWLRQYKEKDSTLPFILVILPSALEESVMTETEVYMLLQDRLKHLAQPHLMRLIEINDIPEGLRLLARLKKRYNPRGKNPIPLVLYDGHGNEDGVFLEGERFRPSVIQHPRFQEIFNKYLRGVFAPTAQFVFGSCNAGDTTYGDGLAQILKQTMHEIFSNKIRVVASAQDVTQFAKLEPHLLKNGSLSLKVKSVPYHPGDTDDGLRGPRFRHM